MLMTPSINSLILSKVPYNTIEINERLNLINKIKQNNIVNFLKKKSASNQGYRFIDLTY